MVMLLRGMVVLLEVVELIKIALVTPGMVSAEVAPCITGGGSCAIWQQSGGTS